MPTVLTTLGIALAALVLGAFLGLITAWPAWTREARQRYVEAMVARGEIERQANRIAFLEGRVREREAEIKQLESEVDAKDLLNEGLKIGMAQLRDRVGDLEREVQQAAVRGRGGREGDEDAAALRRRLGELEPLVLQLAERDKRIRQLERLEAELVDARERLARAREEHAGALGAKEAEVAGLAARVAQLEPAVTALAERDREVERLRGELGEREARRERVESEHQVELAARDAEVLSLRRQVEELQPLRGLLAEREEQLARVAAVETELHQRDERIRRMEQEHRLQVEAREAQIESLREQIRELAPVMQELAKRDERIRELEFLDTQLGELEAMEASLREREVRVNELEALAKSGAGGRDDELRRLRERVAELAPLGERIERRNARIRELEAALDHEQAESERLRRRVSEFEDVHAGAKRAREELAAEVQGLQARLGEAEGRCAERLGERDAEVRTLQGRVAERDSELERLRKRVIQLQPGAKGSARGAASPAATAGGDGGLRRDDLKRIRGIGPAMERKLNRMGCYTFRDIAAWEGAQIERMARALKASPERIRREWVTQARKYVDRRRA
jgi:predicted flap endonuclease-1-like 5' DNA nuclease